MIQSKTVRRWHPVLFCGVLLVGAGTLVSLSWLYQRDEGAGAVCCQFGAFAAAIGAWKFGQTRCDKVRDAEGESLEIDCNRPDCLFRRMLRLSLLAFPAIMVLTGYDLHRLETGAVERVTLMWPLAMVYQHLGYWPTVLLVPTVGAACCLVFLFKIRAMGPMPDDTA